ncbi:hypothetical protein DRH14_00055 [Candidatus Shapirobacteria bacterium]|nr:MAG: hypothetical protein DRH14_00055 [Candidatus Shapirobacteria bacterium]
MKKRIVIFTLSQSQSSYEVGRVVEEAKKMGIEAKRALYKDLSFVFSGGRVVVKLEDKELNQENTFGVWFRVAGTISGKYVIARNVMIEQLGLMGVRCVNSKSYLQWPRMGKISQHNLFVKEGISVVPSWVFYQKKDVLINLDKMGENLGWPMIVKNSMGYQGKTVFKLRNEKEVEDWLERKDEKVLGLYMWQKDLKNHWDVRIVVIDGQVVGAMKRIAKGKEFRSNFSLGGDIELWNLSEKEKDLAEETARVAGLDYVGVDLMRDEKGELYVLEVNRACQFKGFEKATKINVAKVVVEMLIKN